MRKTSMPGNRICGIRNCNEIKPSTPPGAGTGAEDRVPGTEDRARTDRVRRLAGWTAAGGRRAARKGAAGPDPYRMEVNTLRSFAELADRLLSKVVPQTIAEAATCGGGAVRETQSRRCNYETWQYRYRCCYNVGGGYQCSNWSPWSPSC
jgi:hypothetical protein